MMKKQLINMVLVGASTVCLPNFALADNDLVSICGKSDFSVKEQVTVETSRRVSILQGGMHRIEGEGELATDALLKTEMMNIGVSKECAEYFVSKGEQGETNGRVYFKFDRSSLTPASITVLDAMLDKIRNTENKIVLEGHTDSIGSDEYNFALGMKRSLAVQAFFTDNQINENNIESVSFGEKQPVASNSTADGRQLNRRVEIKGL